MPTSTTPADGLAKATALFQTDWDAAGTVSTFLPSDVARSLLEARGWRRESSGAWLHPTSSRVYWETSEALALALAAEVL